MLLAGLVAGLVVLLLEVRAGEAARLLSAGLGAVGGLSAPAGGVLGELIAAGAPAIRKAVSAATHSRHSRAVAGRPASGPVCCTPGVRAAKPRDQPGSWARRG